LLTTGWGPDLAVGADPLKNQWKRVDSGSSDSTKDQMMLNTDLCLAYERSKGYVDCMKIKQPNKGKVCGKLLPNATPLLATTADNCCAWTSFTTL